MKEEKIIEIENEDYKLIIDYGEDWRRKDRAIFKVWKKDDDYLELIEQHCVWLDYEAEAPERWLRKLTYLWRSLSLSDDYPRLWEDTIDLDPIDNQFRFFRFNIYNFKWQQLAEAIKNKLGISDAFVFTGDNGKEYQFIDGEVKEVK